jgi:hypothetical protein
MSPEFTASNIQDRAAALLSDRGLRPTPEEVASLAIAGMTTQDIITAGEVAGIDPPVMSDTLKDAVTLMPYAHLAVDRVVEMGDDALIIAAMRDGEMMGDAAAICQPGRVVSLPASGHLFRDLNKRVAAGDPLVEQFFAQYRMSRDQVVGRKIRLMDTGFEGSIALKLDATLQALYGIPSLIESGAMETYMIRASEPMRSDVHEILHGEDIVPGSLTQETLPKLTAMLGNIAPTVLSLPSYAAAAAMQIMPRHTGHYLRLTERDGRVIAVDAGYADPGRRMRPQPNVDVVYGLNANANVYNPVASLVVQHLVVSTAMGRTLAQDK